MSTEQSVTPLPPATDGTPVFELQKTRIVMQTAVMTTIAPDEQDAFRRFESYIDRMGERAWKTVEELPNYASLKSRADAVDGLVEAAAKHLEWIDKERQGPIYPEGASRNSKDGEVIWRKWWDEQLALCAETESLCRAALSLVVPNDQTNSIHLAGGTEQEPPIAEVSK